jgi:tungstate transport system substrate-binding protein
MSKSSLLQNELCRSSEIDTINSSYTFSTATWRHRLSAWTRRALLILSWIAVTSGVILTLFSYVQAQSLIRLQVVNVPVDSGLLTELLPDFERTTGYRVEVDKNGDQVYDFARRGAADLVLSHYGHHGVDDFMADGLGLWPRVVFANQAVLIGPSSDRAAIRGLNDAVEAFRRIAQTRSRFVVNNAPTEKYLAQILWEAAGRPDRTGWYTDSGLRDQQAIQAAERSEAYTLWGIIPFLRFKQTTTSSLEALVLDDPVLQRMMMTVLVNPEKVPGVNISGAFALQKYLALPSTQARIRAFRYPGVVNQLFWPAARDNIGSFLSDDSPLSTTTDPAVNSIVFGRANVRIGDLVTATFAGVNLSAQMYFDVRFRRPGAATDEIAQDWQQGPSATHNIAAATQPGIWRITGVRAHREASDHSGSFIPVPATLTVVP